MRSFRFALVTTVMFSWAGAGCSSETATRDAGHDRDGWGGSPDSALVDVAVPAGGAGDGAVGTGGVGGAAGTVTLDGAADVGGATGSGGLVGAGGSAKGGASGLGGGLDAAARDGSGALGDSALDVPVGSGGRSRVDALAGSGGTSGVGGTSVIGGTTGGRGGTGGATVVPGPCVPVKAIAAGLEHTCMLTTQGGVRCWGKNDVGQMGDGLGRRSLLGSEHLG